MTLYKLKKDWTSKEIQHQQKLWNNSGEHQCRLPFWKK